MGLSVSVMRLRFLSAVEIEIEVGSLEIHQRERSVFLLFVVRGGDVHRNKDYGSRVTVTVQHRLQQF
jgi:hypothetical protein